MPKPATYGREISGADANPNFCSERPPASGAVRVSSLEIAELTGKQHGHVLRDARKMLAELAKFDGLKFEPISSYETAYIDAMGRSKPCLMLPWLETMTLLSGYSVPMRAKVIARWAELENAARSVAAQSAALRPPQELFPPNLRGNQRRRQFFAVSPSWGWSRDPYHRMPVVGDSD